MFSFIDKNYLNTTRDFNGRGRLFMGKTADGRIVAALASSNGSIAGDATAANQVLEITELQNANSFLQTIADATITTSITETVTLGSGATNLNSYTGSKKVTIINTDTIALSINLNSANDVTLPIGYAIDLFTTDPANISVTGTNGFNLPYIVYA